ncbi:MAG: hypothetical protein HY279_07425, partial [Nitrospinae bacterium]|nr:hypothetical protein [Nitrospinota bacterium]
MKILYFLIISLILLFHGELANGEPVEPSKSWAAPPLILDPGKEVYPLSIHLDILEDKEGKWTIEDVTSPKLSDKFIPHKNESTPGFGFTNSAYWVRFKVKNPPKSPFSKGGLKLSPPLQKGGEGEWLLEIALPILDRVDLYIPPSPLPLPSGERIEVKGGFIVKKSGRLVPFKEWEIRHRSPAFYLPIDYGEEKTYYLRFKTESLMSFPMTLWSRDSFDEKDADEYIALGIYYGIISVMVLYNFFIFLSLRDRNYLFYILYVACYGLFQAIMNGIAYEYIWHSLPWWNKHANIFFGMSTIFWIAAFTKGILMTKRHTPKLDRLI